MKIIRPLPKDAGYKAVGSSARMIDGFPPTPGQLQYAAAHRTIPREDVS